MMQNLLFTHDRRMPILNGTQCTVKIRELEASQSMELVRLSHNNNGRIPILAVSASLREENRMELAAKGFDGWILKPIAFGRLNDVLGGILDPAQRLADLYHPGCSWESGGWLCGPMGSTENLVSRSEDKLVSASTSSSTS